MIETGTSKNEVLDNFAKKQQEKEYYLQEFKERVIVSLNKAEVETGVVYPEIIEAMHEPDAELLKMRRDIELKLLKPYILVAEKLGLKHVLIDSADLKGDIGIVVVSKEELSNEDIDLEIDAKGEDFEKRGLKAYYIKHLGKKICEKHFKMIEEKYPVYKGSFKKFGLGDKVFGAVCPLCEEEKKEK